MEGFNNLTKVVSFNLYDFFVARTDDERARYVRWVDAGYCAARLTTTLRGIAELIDAEVLSVSSTDYEPQGASSLVLMSDLGHKRGRDISGLEVPRPSVGAHLSKSHLCAHTYPDWTDPNGICSLRVDIEIATCGTIVPLRALDFMFESFASDVVIVDYVVRGFTRDADGQRVYMDHTVGSIQDYISPTIVADYRCRDLTIAHENIWQTRLVRRRLEPTAYFPDGADPDSSENRGALAEVRRAMAEIFGGPQRS